MAYADIGNALRPSHPVRRAALEARARCDGLNAERSVRRRGKAIGAWAPMAQAQLLQWHRCACTRWFYSSVGIPGT